MTHRCLLIIDLVNDYLDIWDAREVDRIVQNTNTLVDAYRRFGQSIIWVRQEFRADLGDAFLEMRDRNILVTIEGTRGAQLHDALHCEAGDMVIVKKRYSAFFKTGLEEVLSERGVSEVALCGINTHACIRMAAIDAYQRDLRVVLAEECIGSYDKEHERVSLAYMNGKIAAVLPVSEIVLRLAGSLAAVATIAPSL